MRTAIRKSLATRNDIELKSLVRSNVIDLDIVSRAAKARAARIIEDRAAENLDLTNLRRGRDPRDIKVILRALSVKDDDVARDTNRGAGIGSSTGRRTGSRPGSIRVCYIGPAEQSYGGDEDQKQGHRSKAFWSD